MTNQEFLKQILAQFKKPIPSKWRVQSYAKTRPSATVMSYIDARDCMDLLDEHAIYGWNREHYEIDGKVYCRVGIYMPDGTIQYRSDCGTESNTEKEKGQSSDSFKRACVNFGIGRFLYDLPVVKVATDIVKAPGNYPNIIDENGQIIRDLNAYCNRLHPADRRAPINAKALSQALEKIKAGDDTIKDKTIKAFCLTKEQLALLEYQHNELVKQPVIA